MLSNFLPLLFLALCNIVFAIIVIVRRKKKPYNAYYAGVLFSLAGWSFGLGMFYIGAGTGLDRLWVDIFYMFNSFTISFFLPFTLLYQGIDEVKASTVFIIFEPSLVIAYLLFFTNTIVVHADASLNVITYGPLYYLLYIWHLVIYTVICFGNLLANRKKATGVARTQMRYVFFSTLIPIVLACLTNLVLPSAGIFNYMHYGPFFSLIMIIVFSYALIRYDFSWTYLKDWNKNSGFL